MLPHSTRTEEAPPGRGEDRVDTLDENAGRCRSADARPAPQPEVGRFLGRPGLLFRETGALKRSTGVAPSALDNRTRLLRVKFSSPSSTC